MVSAIRYFAVLLLGTASALAQLDLSAQVTTRELEGVTFRELRFRDGKVQVSYEPPLGWTFAGGPSRLKLAPPDMPQVDASIEVIGPGKPTASDESRLNMMRDAAVQNLPAGADQVNIVSQEAAVVQVNGRNAAEVNIGYVFNGQRFMTSVILVELTDSQLKCKMTSRAENFPALHAAFRKSLCSFQWLPAGK